MSDLSKLTIPPGMNLGDRTVPTLADWTTWLTATCGVAGRSVAAKFTIEAGQMTAGQKAAATRARRAAEAAASAGAVRDPLALVATSPTVRPIDATPIAVTPIAVAKFLEVRPAKLEVTSQPLPGGGVLLRYGSATVQLYGHAVAKDPELVDRMTKRLASPSTIPHPTMRAMRLDRSGARPAKADLSALRITEGSSS